MTKTNPANHLLKILQPHHFINTSTNPGGGHMSNYVRQIKVNMANEPLKVEQPQLRKVQVKWINYRAKPIPNIPQTPKLP